MDNLAVKIDDDNLETLSNSVANLSISNDDIKYTSDLSASTLSDVDYATLSSTGTSSTITIPSISSGSWTTTTPNTIWTTTSTPYLYTEKTKNENTVEVLKDLLEEIQTKYDKAEQQMDELVKMMKEHRENLGIYNATFQYYVGIKTSLSEMIEKLNKYIEDNSPEETKDEKTN